LSKAVKSVRAFTFLMQS